MFPDYRAAGRLLEKIDRMLPGVDLDLNPLYDEAENIEKKIKDYMKKSKNYPQIPQTNIPGMYQ
jgi:predicted ATP-grasp superfamily ATP-dependent carboligase